MKDKRMEYRTYSIKETKLDVSALKLFLKKLNQDLIIANKDWQIYNYWDTTDETKLFKVINRYFLL